MNFAYLDSFCFSFMLFPFRLFGIFAVDSVGPYQTLKFAAPAPKVSFFLVVILVGIWCFAGSGVANIETSTWLLLAVVWDRSAQGCVSPGSVLMGCISLHFPCCTWSNTNLGFVDLRTGFTFSTFPLHLTTSCSHAPGWVLSALSVQS